VITLSTGPDWASIVTAIGTVLVAIVAVGIALWSEWRTGKRLADERAFSRAQIEEERRIARNGEQFSEAYAVQVTVGEITTTPEPPNEYGDPGPLDRRREALPWPGCSPPPEPRSTA